MSDQDQKKKSSFNPLRVIGSVLAAGFGVQSGKNRERDFKEGKLTTFLVAGILFTALLVVSIYFVVSLVLENAR